MTQSWEPDVSAGHQRAEEPADAVFFSACEVLKAGSSVKLIPPHANCEVIVFVHADSRSASLQAPPIRLYGHIEHVFAAQSCALQFCPSKHPWSCSGAHMSCSHWRVAEKPQWWCADGEIHVTLKDGKPYSLWNIVSLAHHATQGVLILKTTCPFHADQYPGKTIAQHDCKHEIVSVVLKQNMLEDSFVCLHLPGRPCCRNRTG